MDAYLVRLKANAELVGIFVAPTADKLWMYVDECRYAFDCEYLLLPAGGIYLDGDGPKVPTKLDPDNEDSFPNWFAGGVLSDHWSLVFHGYQDLAWAPIVNNRDN